VKTSEAGTLPNTSEDPMRTTFLALIIGVALIPGPGEAQLAAHAGERVRVTSSKGDVTVGTVEAVVGDSVTVLTDRTGAPYVIHQNDVEQVEMSLGQQRNFGKFFLLSLAATTAGGGIISALTWSPCESDGMFSCGMLHPGSRGEALATGGFIGGVIGLPIGLLVGVFATEERWSPVGTSDSPGTQVSIVRMAGNRVGLRASIPR